LSPGLLPQLLQLLLVCKIKESCCLDSVIEQIRQEGIEKLDIGVMLEERVEFIHSKIALRPMLNSIHNFDKLNMEFGVKINTSFGKLLHRKTSKMSHTIRDKTNLLSGHRVERLSRKKRSIEFIGNLISKAFGNPGPEDWRKNNANILAMKAAISRQKDNSILLHEDIDSNKHMIEKHNDILKQVSLELYRSENRLDQTSTEMNELEVYLELELMYESITAILDSLHEIKLDSKSNRCNQKGLNQDFLMDRLRSIESNKLGYAPVFASWEWENYFRYEMCSVAINYDELWITLRIPVVKPMEKLIRTIPHSSLVWIRKNLDDFGIDSSIYKDKNHEIYHVMTQSNYETCSVLGTTRVCNVRKIKFRESANCVVPVELGFGRILMISNSTLNLTFSAYSSCNEMNDEITFSKLSVLKVPNSCSIKSKNFEIDIKFENSFISNEIRLAKIDNVESKMIVNRISDSRQIEIQTISNASSLANIEYNNNLTQRELDKVHTTQDDLNSNIHFMKIGGYSTISIIASLAICALILVMIRKCGKKSSSGEVNLEMNFHDSAINKDESSVSSTEKKEDSIKNENECDAAKIPQFIKK